MAAHRGALPARAAAARGHRRDRSLADRHGWRGGRGAPGRHLAYWTAPPEFDRLRAVAAAAFAARLEADGWDRDDDRQLANRDQPSTSQTWHHHRWTAHVNISPSGSPYRRFDETVPATDTHVMITYR